ncbi:hypothetical protein [Evansella tamaricis]|uniref:Uncharacterized protein n=1 Tax=Evansella tamaricis TaxID=2069301 RepID=A0ABS6JHE8_9BACI|nr:hypothetical protein [Evansella tamaricis]MBU9713102.1 hypothetical protein [Evansella tamaricis]
MNEKKQFILLIGELKNTLMKHHLFRFVQYNFFFVITTVFFLAMAGRWFVITNLYLWMLLLSLFVITGASYYWYKKRPTNQEVVQLYDETVKENRVLTAFSFLSDNREISIFQRRDAVRRMKDSIQHIHEKLQWRILWKELSISLILLAGVILSFLYPSEQMLAASDLNTNKELLNELEEEVESIEDQVKEELQDLLDQLQDQLKGVEDTDEALQEILLSEARLEVLRLELLEKEQELNQMADMFYDAGLTEMAEALKSLNEESVQDALEHLFSNMDQLTEEQKKLLVEWMKNLEMDNIGSLEDLTSEEVAELLEKIEQQLKELVTANLDLEAIQKLQEQIQQIAQSLNRNMVNAGLSENTSLSFTRSPSTNQSSNGNDSGQQGDGDPKGSGDANSGNQAGNNGQNQGGTGNGDGNGVGQSPDGGRGVGNGTGPGGQGAGSGQGSRELVTIPERLTGETNLETDSGELGFGEGERQESETAPVLKGNVRPYQEVLGHYESTYRESINRMQLPHHLEDIVRDYFSELHMEEE